MKSETVLIDTHIFLWLLTESKKIKPLKWIKNYPCLTLSPVTILEVRFLQEIGKIQLDLANILAALKGDDRFQIDNPPLEPMCMSALDLSWTRDPFDRLLVAHSILRSIPLGTCDHQIREHYSNTL